MRVHQRVFVENAADLSAEGARALSVDDADAGESFFVTGPQVLRDEVADVGRIECVQVEFTVDRVFVHTGAGRREEKTRRD